jgi:hypothetical protein
MIPDYEVKLLMEPTKVLGSDNKLTSTVLSTFSMPTSVTKMNVQFLDTDEKQIYNSGWIPRIRKVEKEKDFELTYKRRYPITDSNIDEAVDEAVSEGFGTGEPPYDAQVEWGYQKQTLSVSTKTSASDEGYSGMELPGKKDSRAMLIANAPPRFPDSLAVSRIYGPVLAKRSIGKWSELKLYIEVWPIKDAAGTGIEYIVESSFKTKERETASSKHDELMAFLEDRGWFLPEDSLKTQLIMDRY